jgi:uncharacterized coiled-coil DUF342 family protein
VIEKLEGLAGKPVDDLDQGFRWADARMIDYATKSDPKTFERMESEIEESLALRDQLTKERDEARAAVVTAQGERSELKEEARLSEARVTDLELAHREEKAAWELLKAEMEGKIEATHIQGSSNEEQIKEIERLTSERSLLTSNLNQAKQDLASLEGRFKKLEDELQRYKDDLSTTKGDRDRYKSSYEGVQADLQRTRNDVADLRQTVTQRDKTIKELLEQLQNTGRSGNSGTSPITVGSSFTVQLFNHRRGVQLLMIEEIIATDQSGRTTSIVPPSGNISYKSSASVSVPTGTVTLKITHAELDTSKRPRAEKKTDHSVSATSATVFID